MGRLLASRCDSSLAFSSWNEREYLPMTKTPEEWLERGLPEGTNQGNPEAFPGLCAGRGQNVQHVERSHPPAQPRRRRRHRRRRNARTEKASRNWPRNWNRFPRSKIEYKGTIFEEMDADAIIAQKSRVRSGRRTGPHQHSRQQTPQTIRGRAGSGRSENGSSFHGQRAAPRKHRAHGRSHHRNQNSRDRSGLGARTRQRNRDGRPDARKRCKTA